MRTFLLVGFIMCTRIAWSADKWVPVAQPDLKTKMAAAPVLKPEKLAAGPKTIQAYGQTLVPNPDGKTYDILQAYYKSYSGPTWIFVLDLGTGETKKIPFPDRRQYHLMGTSLGWDGNYYMVTSGRGGMEMWIYHPDTNELEHKGVVAKGITGERRSLRLGRDGRIYGTGAFAGQSKAGLYAYDPKTGKVQNYGPVGPSHKPHGAWGYYLGVCDTHAYVSSGKVPWYLVSINLKTGEQDVLLKTPIGKSNTVVGIRTLGGWPRAAFQPGDGTRTEYWLRGGKMFPKKLEDNTPPWPSPKSPWDSAPEKPEIYDGEKAPDAQGMAALWYRMPKDKPRQESTSASAEENGWKKIAFGPVQTYPLSIHRFVNLGDGRLFGTAQAYIGRFLYDIEDNEVKILGNGGCSTYAFTAYNKDVYWTGYPSGPIEHFNPDKPWHMGAGGPPSQKSDKIANYRNPKRLCSLYKETRVKKMMTTVVAKDGLIYVGGVGQRDYAGGGFGWYDPRTGKKGGMWKPFSAYRIFWLTTAVEGRYVVISTKCSADELNENKVPAEAKIFVWDTQTRQLVRDFVPIPKGNGKQANKAGPLLEVAPGKMIGVAMDPESNGGLIYGVDILKGETLFVKKVPLAPQIRWSQGTRQNWDLARGPKGSLYTYFGSYLCRIDPKTVDIHVLGKLQRPGKLCFVGNDLYLTGEHHVRCLRNVVSPGSDR